MNNPTEQAPYSELRIITAKFQGKTLYINMSRPLDKPLVVTPDLTTEKPTLEKSLVRNEHGGFDLL